MEALELNYSGPFSTFFELESHIVCVYKVVAKIFMVYVSMGVIYICEWVFYGVFCFVGRSIRGYCGGFCFKTPSFCRHM